MRTGNLLVVACLFVLSSCTKSPQPCSDEWNAWVEESVTTGDGQGHGPDFGSDEWKSVVEFRLGVRGDDSVPDRTDPEWCRYIDDKIRSKR